MKHFKKILILVIIVAIGFLIFVFYNHKKNSLKTENQKIAIQENNSGNILPEQEKTKNPEIKFVGPRGNVPDNAPADYGFWSFAISVPGILSRSGQPTIKDFEWLKNNGWKSVVDLRIDGDHNEVSDDAKIPGFNELGFNYLKIQMVDGAAPTNQQAEEFLSFVTKKENQPIHVHCRGGIGRAGIMVALYRYAVDNWPVDQAIEESKLFQGGIDESQKKWLADWAKNNKSGSYTTATN